MLNGRSHLLFYFPYRGVEDNGKFRGGCKKGLGKSRGRGEKDCRNPGDGVISGNHKLEKKIIFNSGGLFFPKDLAGGGGVRGEREVKNVSRTYQRFKKNFRTNTSKIIIQQKLFRTNTCKITCKTLSWTNNSKIKV
jgi:hypothetical protein